MFWVFGDSLATNSGHLLILGDFNIYWDCQRNGDIKQHSLNWHPQTPCDTHINGHILELLISCDSEKLIEAVSVSSMLSDHFLIYINVSFQKRPVSAKVISYRKYKSIHKDPFLANLRVTSLVLDPLDD